jgi:hypothetical protein
MRGSNPVQSGDDNRSLVEHNDIDEQIEAREATRKERRV